MSDERTKRLAEQLRRNLKARKAQARQRRSESDEPSSDEAPEPDTDGASTPRDKA